MFRFITIANLQDLEEFEFTRLRIYDFFFLFPHLVESINFPKIKGAQALKKTAMGMPESYESLPNKKRLFSEIGDYHIQALQILLAKDIFIESNGRLRTSRGYQDKSVSELLDKNPYNTVEFFADLLKILNQVDLAGESGLKKRTGLMEYRYDAI